MLKVMQRLFGGVVNEQNYGEFMKEVGRRFVPKADYNARLAELKELRARADEERIDREELAAEKARAAELAVRAEELQKLLETAACEHEQELKRMRLKRMAELALIKAGAKNLAAVEALLDWTGLTPGAEEQELNERIFAMAEAEDTAFLFRRRVLPQVTDWQGFVPMEEGDVLDDGYAGGFRLRLAQAHNEADCLGAIKVKQEAAAQGVIL